ncbi:MAG: hypothetical protein FJ271_21030 [Planctomycetes bacterium]|nr:hypothetical protein [Planctomycetota bacterium]
MDSDELKTWQARRIHRALFPGFNYLGRLRKRMEKAGFPADDRFLQLVCAAHDAAYALYVHVHYLSCESGAGRAGKK